MSRRVFLSVLLLALLLSLVMVQIPTNARPPSAGTPAAGGVKGVVVASDSLRIRTKPSSTAPEAGSPLKPGVSVTVLGRNDTGVWLVVKTQTGVTGWVGSAYVALVGGGSMKDVPAVDDNAADTLTAAATAPAPEGTEGACPPAAGGAPVALTGVKGVVVAAQSLRIRSKPSSTAAEAGSPLKPSVPVTVLGRNDTGVWLIVQTQTGVIGWVGSAYVALVGGGSMKDVPAMDDNAVDTLTAQMAATAAAPGACPPAEAPAGTAAAPTGGVKGVVVASESLRIRSLPSSTAAEAGSPLKPGVSVTVLGRNDTGVWLYVQTETGVKGWVGSAYVALLAGGSMKDVPVLNDSGTAG